MSEQFDDLIRASLRELAGKAQPVDLTTRALDRTQRGRKTSLALAAAGGAALVVFAVPVAAAVSGGWQLPAGDKAKPTCNPKPAKPPVTVKPLPSGTIVKPTKPPVTVKPLPSGTIVKPTKPPVTVKPVPSDTLTKPTPPSVPIKPLPSSDAKSKPPYPPKPKPSFVPKPVPSDGC